ncbi:MAG: hypothetical protein WC792_01560 [Candidatus Micrarchaeia archaeon]|jgi:hypothetical protein
MNFSKALFFAVAVLFAFSGSVVAEPCNSSLVSLTLALDSDHVKPGDEVRAAASLESEAPDAIDGVLRLQAVDAKSRGVVRKSEDKLGFVGKYGKIRALVLPENASLGSYSLEGIFSYYTANCTGTSEASAAFIVEKNFFDEGALGVPYWILIPFLLGLAAVGAYAYKLKKEADEKEFRIRFH